MIGTFGDVVFVASSEALRTFQNFRRSTVARWALHDIYLKHPKPQFTGPGQDTITFSMQFDIRYGMRPRGEMDRLLDMSRESRVERLIVGGAPVGINRWYIDSLDQLWDRLDGKGNIISSSVNVTLREYT